MLESAKDWQGTAWLCPLTPRLIPAGGPLERTLASYTDRVNGVAVTPDGRRAVSASDDGTLKVWDLESGKELRTLPAGAPAQKRRGHTDRVNGVAVTPDGRGAVSASDDGTLKVWDLESGKELRTLASRISWINGEEIRTLVRNTSGVNGVAVTPDGKREYQPPMTGP
jgi:WD40 repeat protein